MLLYKESASNEFACFLHEFNCIEEHTYGQRVVEVFTVASGCSFSTRLSVPKCGFESNAYMGSYIYTIVYKNSLQTRDLSLHIRVSCI